MSKTLPTIERRTEVSPQKSHRVHLRIVGNGNMPSPMRTPISNHTRRMTWIANSLGWTLSLFLHGGLMGTLLLMPREKEKSHETTIEMAIHQTQANPIREPVTQLPKAMKQKPVPNPKPKKRLAIRKRKAPKPPPAANQQPRKETSKPSKPVFGVSMNSVVSSGPATGAMAVRVGNTLATKPNKDFVPPDQVQPYEGNRLVENPSEKITPSYKLSRMPKVLSLVKAPYPQKARQANIEGEVIMRLTIDETGRVTRVRVIRSLGDELDELAKQAAYKFRFQPALADGTPVTTVIPFTYRWEIID